MSFYKRIKGLKHEDWGVNNKICLIDARGKQRKTKFGSNIGDCLSFLAIVFFFLFMTGPLGEHSVCSAVEFSNTFKQIVVSGVKSYN